VHAILPKRTLQKLSNKRYRVAFVGARVRNWIAYQIRTIREQRGLSQVEFAKEIGKPQSVISRLEDPNYGKLSVQTLLEVAAAFNVALLVKFVDFASFLRATGDASESGMQVADFDEAIAAGSDFDQKTITMTDDRNRHRFLGHVDISDHSFGLNAEVGGNVIH